MKNTNIESCEKFQLKQDPQNDEAHAQFELMNQVEHDVEEAKMMYKHHEFNGAIELLSRLIDVSISSCCIGTHLDHSN